MPTARGWAKLGPEVVVDLLDNAAGVAHQQARILLLKMRRSRWSISATVHAGGFGDARRGADSNAHITLRVGGTNYHLQCKERPYLHLIQITA